MKTEITKFNWEIRFQLLFVFDIYRMLTEAVYDLNFLGVYKGELNYE